jgi:phosphoribosylanthranilate isomerase
MSGLIKICGITDAHGTNVALACGADLTGFVMRPESPRNLTFDTAAQLASRARGKALVSIVLADRGDDFLEHLVARVRPDILQLHGAETPQRVASIRERFGTKVVKTMGVASGADLDAFVPYLPLCEKILIEAKSPDGRPKGGSGSSFDWKLLAAYPHRNRLMIAGGLTSGNVAEAIATTGVASVDVCSGVEVSPGAKDKTKVRQFIRNARAAIARHETTTGDQ